MKAVLVAVAPLQQLQELFLFSSAKMVPGCFCCLTGCWQKPPFWILLMVVLLTTAGPGSWGLPHCLSPEQAARAALAPGIRHLLMDGMRLGQGMAVGN